MVENYYPRWLYKARKLAGKVPEGEPEPDTPYTIANSGVPEFGGWIGKGRWRFVNLLKELKKAYSDPEESEHILAADKEALKRLRVRHKMAEKEAAKKSKKKTPLDILALEGGKTMEWEDDFH